jgi:hypothetical protein
MRETPFYLMYLTDPVLPSDAVLQLPRREYFSTEEYKQHTQMLIRDAFETARNTLEDKQKRNQAYSDKKVNDPEYMVGDLVYVWSPVLGKGLTKKLSRRYHGPYRILAMDNPRLLLRQINKRTAKTQWTHRNRCKPCLTEHVPNFVRPGEALPVAFELEEEITEETQPESAVTAVQSSQEIEEAILKNSQDDVVESQEVEESLEITPKARVVVPTPQKKLRLENRKPEASRDNNKRKHAETQSFMQMRLKTPPGRVKISTVGKEKAPAHGYTLRSRARKD